MQGYLVKYLGKFREMRVNFVSRETNRHRSTPKNKNVSRETFFASAKEPCFVSHETNTYCAAI